MTAADANEFLNPLGFLALGTVLSALLSKMFASRDGNNLSWWFYGFAAICAVFLIYTGVSLSWKALGGAWYLTLICTLALAITTRFVLKTKNIYKTSELDPVINEFTGKANKDFINLLCGDINFFGGNPTEMDKNSQYIVLKTSGFKGINVLCFQPQNNSDRIRYGKLLHDMPAIKLRYYKPSKANLFLRGRITQFQGGDKLLMYFRISAKTYRAIETDTSDAQGALYKNIWDLIWDLAETPPQAELDNFIQLSQQ